MATAQRVFKPAPDGGVQIDDYAEQPIKLVTVAPKAVVGTASRLSRSQMTEDAANCRRSSPAGERFPPQRASPAPRFGSSVTRGARRRWAMWSAPGLFFATVHRSVLAAGSAIPGRRGGGRRPRRSSRTGIAIPERVSAVLYVVARGARGGCCAEALRADNAGVSGGDYEYR